MADTLLLPAWSAQPLGQDGRFTREWYSYLTNLELRATGEVADLSALTARVAALEGEGGSGSEATLNGPASVNVVGTLGSGAVSLLLVGDLASPSPWNVYGTDAEGAKGWTDITNALPPTFIASGESYTVPVNRQALFTLPIDVEGELVLDGALVEV